MTRDLDSGATVGVLYSEYPSAERWDLEFGSNTTEKFGKPDKKSVKLDPVGSSVRYEVMKLCTGSV